MSDSIMVLAEFSNGVIGYKEYLEFVDSGLISDYIVEIMPYDVFELSVHVNNITMLEQLCIMDKLREWGESGDLTRNQFIKCKAAVFDSLKINLIAAFSDASLEDGITLAQANAIDCYQSEEKQAIARRSDENITWKNYAKQDLENFTSLPYLDKKGFAYYIPAYFLWCIDSFFRAPYSNIVSQIFGAFDPETSGFSMRISALTHTQRKWTKEFLWLFAVHSDVYRETIVLGIQAFEQAEKAMPELALA